MADYREISQTYAQGAIKAVILINSGALVACLSQMESLLSHIGGTTVGISFGMWILGVCLAAAAWISGFFSTRFVDVSERGFPKAIEISNRYMFAALGAVALSLVCFLAGSFALCIRLINL